MCLSASTTTAASLVASARSPTPWPCWMATTLYSIHSRRRLKHRRPARPDVHPRHQCRAGNSRDPPRSRRPKRRRLGRIRGLRGPGLRTFLGIRDLWKLAEDQRRLVFRFPARSTYHNWAKPTADVGVGVRPAKRQRDHGLIPVCDAWGHPVQRSRSGGLIGRCSLDDSRDRRGSPRSRGSSGAQGADADAKVPNLHSDPGRRPPRYWRPIDRKAPSTSPRRIIMRSRLKRAQRAWRCAGWSAD